MRISFLLIIFLGSFSSLARTITFDVESESPAAICKNVKELVYLFSPYLDIDLVSCKKKLVSKSWLGHDDYSVNVVIETSVEACRSQDNQAIVFDIPTNTYPHWNPPLRYQYLDYLIEELGLESEVAVRNLGATGTPSYKQIVFIPECAFKND